MMSNNRRIRWNEALVTAATAEQLIGQLFADAEAAVLPGVTRKVIGEALLADLARRGCEPGQVAAIERRMLDLGDEFWAGVGREIMPG
jgi:hypothetical protein